MKEWIYRKGYIKTHYTRYKWDWKMWLFALGGMPLVLGRWDVKHFIDLINEKGEIRRIWVKGASLK